MGRGRNRGKRKRVKVKKRKEPGEKPAKPSHWTRPGVLNIDVYFTSTHTSIIPFCPQSQCQTKCIRHSTAHVRGTSLSPKLGTEHSLGIEEP